MAPIRVLLAGYIEDSGTTQAAVAKRLGVSQPAVSAWLNGDSAPSDALVPAVADLLGASVADVNAACYEQRLERSTRRAGGVQPQQPMTVAEFRRLVAKLEQRIAELEGEVERLHRQRNRRRVNGGA